MMDVVLLQDLVEKLRVPVRRHFVSPSEISLRQLVAFTEVMIREEFGYEVRVRVEHTFLGFSIILRDSTGDENFVSFSVKFEEEEVEL